MTAGDGRKKNSGIYFEAVRVLISRHRDEFDTINGDMRVAAGLSRVPGSSGGKNTYARRPTPELQKMKERYEARMKKIAEELEKRPPSGS